MVERVHGGKKAFYTFPVIDFSSNVNCFGPPRKVLAIFRGDLIREIASYPDPDYPQLKEALALYTLRKPTEIFLGNGSVEIFFWVAHILRPKRVLIISPSFCEYYLAAESAKGKIREYFLKEEEGFIWDLKEVKKMASLVDLIFMGNPNNPTGNLFRKEEILELKRSLKSQAVLVVDEAFMDFCEEQSDYTLLPEVDENVWVTRSLTKFFSLAGLRVGYLIAPSTVVRELERKSPPWRINSLAEKASLLALSDKDYVERMPKKISQERTFFFRLLKKIPYLRPFPSVANFFLVEVRHPRLNSERLQSLLLSKGFLIRNASSFRGLSHDYIRLAVRRREENLALVKGIERLFKEGENC